MHTPHTLCPQPDSEGMAYNTQHTGGIILLGDLEKFKNMQQSTQEEKNLTDVKTFILLWGLEKNWTI